MGDAAVRLSATGGAVSSTAPALPQAESTPPDDGPELPPWQQYHKVNGKFTRLGNFVHTVAWTVSGRHVLTVIPHETTVDIERLSRALREPRSAVKLRTLKDIASQTGWPVFVCPPFGHPKDKDGRDPVLFVDSKITEFKKPLLFDCGTVGLSMPVSELLRS